MGPMTSDPCEDFRGLIAMEVVGQLSGSERVALSAHIEGCRSCRDERQDLLALAPVLGTADPDRIIDDESGSNGERHQRKIVEAEARDRHDGEGGDQRHR